MARKGSIPAGEDFLPGTSAEELGRMAKVEKDGKTARKFLAAHHRKMGSSIAEIAWIVSETYGTARRWLADIHKGGLGAVPRRKNPGAPRKIPLEVRHMIIRDVQMGPQAAGYSANAWTVRLLHKHVAKKYGIKMAYSTAAKNFYEMGIRLKTPRPMHPQAASAEERLAFQREAREKIEEGAKEGYHPVFVDEAHIQGYKNGNTTLGLRGVEAVRTSSVDRARLSVYVAVGDGWCFFKDGDAGNSEGYTAFLDRTSSLIGKVQTIDDNAGYHISNVSKAFIAKNSHRLRRIATLPYTPDYNAAEPQIRMIKAAVSNVGLDSVGAIRGELKWCVEKGLIDPVMFYKYAVVDSSPRISPRKARSIKKNLEEGEHFVYVRRPRPEKEYKVPTMDDLRAREDRILPPEKRAALPPILAHSNIPANFLARLPPVLLAE